MNRRRRRYSPPKLRQQMRAAGLSYAELADALDVTANYVKMLCSGRRQINERMARAVAYTLDINVRELEEDNVRDKDRRVSQGARADPKATGRYGRHPSDDALQD